MGGVMEIVGGGGAGLRRFPVDLGDFPLFLLSVLPFLVGIRAPVDLFRARAGGGPCQDVLSGVDLRWEAEAESF